MSEPVVEKNDSREGLTEEEIAEHREERAFMGEFLTICGEQGEDGEAKTFREIKLENLLRSACAIAERKGEDTAWDRFTASAAKLGINSITARTYRVVTHAQLFGAMEGLCPRDGGPCERAGDGSKCCDEVARL